LPFLDAVATRNLLPTFHRRMRLEGGAPSAASPYACRLISNPISRRPDPNRYAVRQHRAGGQSLQPRRGCMRLPRKGHAEMPLPVEAIQLDGGSEFKAEFEQACQANEQLLVLVELVTPRSIDLERFPASLRSPRAPRRPRRTNPGRLPQSAPSNRCPRHLRCADPADPRPRLVAFPRKAYDPARKVASW
jgi:hypothetical protein